MVVWTDGVSAGIPPPPPTPRAVRHTRYAAPFPPRTCSQLAGPLCGAVVPLVPRRPDCIMSPFARDNHLGNSVPKVDENAGLWSTNRAPSYEWTIPGDVLNQNGVSEATCVLRMRYNISTTDYDSWGLSGEMVDAKFNGADAKVKQDNGGGKDVVGVNAPAALGTNYLLNLVGASSTPPRAPPPTPHGRLARRLQV